MKGKSKRSICLLAALLLAAALLFGCAADKSDQGAAAPGQSANGAQDVGMTEESTAVRPEQKNTNQKLIYTGNIEVETQQFEDDFQMLKQKVSEMGGYLSGESVSGTVPVAYGDPGRRGELTARIPTEKFQQFLDETAGQLDVVYKNIDVEDVIERYYDNEARIELLELRYAKLEEHLKAATKMEDIITLEAKMGEILSELDELKGTRRHLDNQVEYSTLTIALTEAVSASSVGTSKKGVGSRMGEAFSGTLRSLGVFFENFAIFLVGSLPVLLILGVVAVIVIFSVRTAKKRKARKKQNSNQ